MIKFIVCAIFSFSMIFSAGYSEILEVKDLSKFQEYACSLDETSLVLFDIDYTILTPQDASLRPRGMRLRKQFLHGLDPKRREYLQSLLALQSEETLVDPLFPTLIRNLQQKKIPVVGLTALETGAYGKVASLEDWRLGQLKKLGIDLSYAFHASSPLLFTECSSYNGNYPLFKNGVIFTNRQSKGEVFTAFLKKIDWMPKKVLFVDDSIQQIHSVESAANALGIEYVGFHYTAAEGSQADFDQKLGEFQFRYLVEHEEWLPDEVAKKRASAL